jgi:uncharacterized protein (DUF488 family)
MNFYTIGYEKRELDEFVDILKENGIQVVADIRIRPISRKKGFSKNQLAAALKKAGIEYAHFVELGAPQEIRDRLHADWDYTRFYRDYEAYLNTQTDTLGRLADLASKQRACIMCFERDVNQCHRKSVAAKLSKIRKYLKVVHL